MPSRSSPAARSRRPGPRSPRGPRGYDPRAFPPVAVTVDLLVFTVRDDVLRVLLVRRGEEPFRGDWALPGGFVRPDEDLERAARRELAEETGLTGEGVFLEQLAAYGAPRRDPRMRVVTVAFWAIAGDLPPPRGGSDAAEAEFVPVKDIEEGGVRLAFDHYRIVRDAVTHIRDRLEEPMLAARFCPPEFTIRQLRQVYEAVWRTPMDPANFQRRVRSSRLFRRSAITAPSGERGGRPASVWTAEGGGPEAEAALPRSAPPGLESRPRARVGRGAAVDGVRVGPASPAGGAGEPDEGVEDFIGASAPEPPARSGSPPGSAPPPGSGPPSGSASPPGSAPPGNAPRPGSVPPFGSVPPPGSAPPPDPEPAPAEPRRVRFTPPRRRRRTTPGPPRGDDD